MITVGFFAFSCLDNTNTDFSKVTPTVEMLGITAGHAIAYTLLPAKSGHTYDSIMVSINATGATAPSKDVTLSLGVSQAALDLYNQDTSHVVGTLLDPSTNSYTFPSSVTITAGLDDLGNHNRTVSFWLVLTGANIPPTPGINYVIPIGITGAPAGYIISSNQGNIMYNFYHNPWDGDYHSKGTRYNYNVVGDYTGWDFAADAPKSTASGGAPTWDFAHTAAITVNSKNTLVHEGNSDGGFGLINLKVNSNNTVTISSTCPANDGSCSPPLTNVANLFPLDGGPPSTYDPATKTFNLYYKYTNPAGTFRVLHDVLVHN